MRVASTAVLRKARSRSKRLDILADAQAVLGCLNKGRTSAPLLVRPARRVAALSLAGGMCVKYVYMYYYIHAFVGCLYDGWVCDLIFVACGIGFAPFWECDPLFMAFHLPPYGCLQD